jgi:hypothetical protein
VELPCTPTRPSRQPAAAGHRHRSGTRPCGPIPH